jgi:hypothetical protein
VFVVNSAQIAYGTLNVNETLALATRQAAALEPILRAASGRTEGDAGAMGSPDDIGTLGAVPSSLRTIPVRA